MKVSALSLCLAVANAGRMEVDDDTCVTNADCCDTFFEERMVCSHATEEMRGLYQAEGNYCVLQAMCGWEWNDGGYSVRYDCADMATGDWASECGWGMLQYGEETCIDTEDGGWECWGYTDEGDMWWCLGDAYGEYYCDYGMGDADYNCEFYDDDSWFCYGYDEYEGFWACTGDAYGEYYCDYAEMMQTVSGQDYYCDVADDGSWWCMGYEGDMTWWCYGYDEYDY